MTDQEISARITELVSESLAEIKADPVLSSEYDASKRKGFALGLVGVPSLFMGTQLLVNKLSGEPLRRPKVTATLLTAGALGAGIGSFFGGTKYLYDRTYKTRGSELDYLYNLSKNNTQ